MEGLTYSVFRRESIMRFTDVHTDLTEPVLEGPLPIWWASLISVGRLLVAEL